MSHYLLVKKSTVSMSIPQAQRKEVISSLLAASATLTSFILQPLFDVLLSHAQAEAGDVFWASIVRR